MFDSEDWNVDQVAQSLDSSLFGPATPIQHKKKKKKSSLPDYERRENVLFKKSGMKRKGASSGMEDTKPESMKKKKKKKQNKLSVSPKEQSEVKSGEKNHRHLELELPALSQVQVTPVSGAYDQGNVQETLQKAGSLEDKKAKKKKKRKKKHIDGPAAEKIPIKQINKDKSKVRESESQNKLESNHEKNKRKPSSDKDDKKVEHKSKKKRKRKASLDESQASSPTKKAKDDESQKSIVSKQENGHMTRKERRNKRKRKNSKKNKYKHLALASQADKSTTEQDLNSLCPTLTLSNTTGNKEEGSCSGSGKFEKTVETFSETKKKKLKRRIEFNEDMKCPSESDSVKHIGSLKGTMKISGRKKSKKKEIGERKLKENSRSSNDFENNIQKGVISKKQKLDRTKLKEVMSSTDKKLEMFIEEGNKKSSKRKELSEKSLSNSKNAQIENIPGNKNNGKNNRPKMKVQSGQTPKKQSFDVKKLKEVMSSEEKMMKVFWEKDGKKQLKKNKGSEKSLTEKMQERLSAARFRYLNEQLYTTTGEEAAKLFVDDDDAFHVYHQGYEAQVSKWPVDPLSIIIKQIKARKKSPNTVIADMGCGSARLAQSITGVQIHSFDLVAVNKWVTACNMSEVPLDDGSVDVVVFCLSLMGTNLVDYLLEANRILKTGGTMKIAEVESRFKKVGAFVSKVEKLGFEVVTKDLSNKMFYLFDFKKVKTTGRSPFSPKIELDPCVYKKR